MAREPSTDGASAASAVTAPGAAASIPWEERPAGNSAIMWRSTRNPVVPADLLPDSHTIFNSAAVPFENRFAGVFRVDNDARELNLHAGFSDDGVTWTLDEFPIEWMCDDPDIDFFEQRYDPRVCFLDGRYVITWCNYYHGPTVGIGETEDFRRFRLIENAFLPNNRNGVLFPRRINGDYLMLSRPSDRGHTPFGEIFLSRSPDLVHWGRHRWVLKGTQGWSWTKVGAGPIPIETPEGWLMIYHGVHTSCSGMVYAVGAALLDLDEPWRVIADSKRYLISPQAPYERVGDTPNVCFPCAAMVGADGDQLAMYYGAADTTVCLAFARISELTAWIKENDRGRNPRGR